MFIVLATGSKQRQSGSVPGTIISLLCFMRALPRTALRPHTTWQCLVQVESLLGMCTGMFSRYASILRNCPKVGNFREAQWLTH